MTHYHIVTTCNKVILSQPITVTNLEKLQFEFTSTILTICQLADLKAIQWFRDPMTMINCGVILSDNSQVSWLRCDDQCELPKDYIASATLLAKIT
jgi:hypothetical protein